jgi:hypothetical protein
MSGFLHDVAGASLPVAIVVLILTAAARAAVWARVDKAAAERIAREYAEALSTWCLILLAIHTAALGASGRARALSVALALALGAAAVMLRPGGALHHTIPAEPEAQPDAPAVRPPSPAGSLWARRVAEDSPTYR